MKRRSILSLLIVGTVTLFSGHLLSNFLASLQSSVSYAVNGFLRSKEKIEAIHNELLTQPSSNDGKPVIVYGPPFTAWISSGKTKGELQIPDPFPIYDSPKQALIRGQIRKQKATGWTPWPWLGWGYLGGAICFLLTSVSACSRIFRLIISR